MTGALPDPCSFSAPAVRLGPDGIIAALNPAAAAIGLSQGGTSAPGPGWTVLELSDGGRLAVLGPEAAGRGPREAGAAEPGGTVATVSAGQAGAAGGGPAADDAARLMLFATLSHEIRTPLNGILGMTGLLAGSPLTEAQRAWLNVARESGQHLLGLLNDILDYAKLNAGKIALEHVPFDPAATAQGVVELLSPRAAEKGIEIAVDIHPGLPATLIGDDGRLRQILLNLAGNAVKFTQTGGVTVRLAPEPGGLLAQVIDTGVGIAPDRLDHVFEAFAQEDASTSRRYGGTGLGLAIVAQLAAAMGGSVAAASTPGQGSTFSIRLPMRDRTVSSAVETRAKPALAGIRIHLCAPSQTVAAPLAALLAGAGADLTMHPQSRPRAGHILLLDHALAKGDLAPWRRRGARIVVLTPQEDRAALDAYRAAGVDGWLIKPLRPAAVLERLALIAQAAAHAPDTDERAHPGAAPGLRVLMAEDNPVNALLARALLERAGCVVETVGDGAEAVEHLARTGYDLVLLDLHMPVLDGLAAARAIRALPGAAAATPLVALTAAASEDDRRTARRAGMDDFLTKPLDPDALGALLKRWSRPQAA
jgi:signal transduction histidine kinase/CheY-like chemotaxis protein